MKRLFILLTVAMLLLTACANEDPEPTEPDPTQPTTAPTSAPTQPSAPETPWDEFSDYELMEQTLKSDAIDHRGLSSYWFSDQEWLVYMMENCEPFKELMFRETALESLEQYSPELVTKYKDDHWMNAQGFAELVGILHPEMKDTFDVIFFPPEITDTVSWIVPEAYNNFLRAMNSSPQAALRYLHFEDAEAETVFIEDFSPITEGNMTMQGRLSEKLYSVTAFIQTEQAPEGQTVTHFVGCIGDRWLVMLTVDQIPAELKEGMDLSGYL